jgi:bacteriorhodopsin
MNNSKELLVNKSFIISKYLIITCLIIIIISFFIIKNKNIKFILLFEIFICLISSIIYTIINKKIKHAKIEHISIDYSNISKKRYFGWIFTTPVMLIVLCLVLCNNINIKPNCLIIASIILLDEIMLYIGYQGENKMIDRNKACILGFIPFIIMFLIIYIYFIKSQYNIFNLFLYITYLILWTIYGLVYLFDEEYKNIITNGLDVIAKGFIGVIISLKYILL